VISTSKYPVPGLVPGTHVFMVSSRPLQDVDARDKPGQGDFTETIGLCLNASFGG